jgi:hypothetical protein
VGSDPRAPLHSVATTLREMTARIRASAEEHLADGDEGTASDLYEVERALRTADRRLARILAPRR